jgi:hypothetical protein
MVVHRFTNFLHTSQEEYASVFHSFFITAIIYTSLKWSYIFKCGQAYPIFVSTIPAKDKDWLQIVLLGSDKQVDTIWFEKNMNHAI